VSQLRLVCPDLPETPDWHLSVDGMSPRGPNLSHWPGNRTPLSWKADLSTGICLNFARAPAAEQVEFLAGATTVLNDHYDTDGFLSLLAAVRPEVVLAREALALEAAATGDFQAFQNDRGFAVDRIVVNLAAGHSPFAAEFRHLAGAARDHARYRWLLDHAAEVLDHPDRFATLFADELATVHRQLDDPGIEARLHPELGLAIIRSRDAVHRMVLNTRAGGCFRVLHTQMTRAGHVFRFHDRTESWFEVATFSAPPRVDLGPLRDALQEADPAPDASWNLDPRTEPVPELYHGIAAPQAYGQLTRTLTPSPLPVTDVEALFADFFAEHG
jgi:Family of unknown function (DUF6687)